MRTSGFETRPNSVLVLIAARGLWAMVLLFAPRVILRMWKSDTQGWGVALLRVLGARHALQCAVEMTCWPRWKRFGVLVDLLHALSAFAVGALDPLQRKAPRYDGIVASLFAFGGLVGDSTNEAAGAH